MQQKEQELVSKIHIPRWNELPEIDLYLDQVVNYINDSLSKYILFEENDKKENMILTKSMINNYVKNNLIDAPVRKLYSKVQLAKLFVICVLKQVYSMQEIDILIKLALEFSTLEKAYDRYCELFEEALVCTYTKKDFIDKNTGSDNMYLLKSVLLACSYKIYVQNIVVNKKKKEPLV